MGVRAKQAILDKTAKHFKDFDLPLDIDHKSYVAIVGPRVATSAIEVKRSFKAWKYLLLAIRKNQPRIIKAPTPAPAPAPAPKKESTPKAKPIPKAKPAPAAKKSDD